MKKMVMVLLIVLLGQMTFGFISTQTNDGFHELTKEDSMSIDSPKNDRHIIPPTTTNQKNELSQRISKQIHENRNKNNIISHGSSQKNFLISQIRPFATQENHIVTVGQSLTISGTLKSGQVPWTDEQIILIRPGYANLTTTTDSSTGDYQFSLIYTTNDIGKHNYTVYFPGNPSLLRQAAVLKEGVITVKDTITLKATTDQTSTTVPPNTPYNVIITLTYSDNSPFDPTAVTFTDEFNTPYDFSTLALNVSETYQDTGGGTPDTSTALNLIDIAVSSDTIIIPSNTGNQISSMDILLSVFLKNIQPFSEMAEQKPKLLEPCLLKMA